MKKLNLSVKKPRISATVGFLLALAALTAGCESEIEKNIRESKERGAANIQHFAEKAKKGLDQEMQKKNARRLEIVKSNSDYRHRGALAVCN